VFEANNISLEDLTEDERAQVIEALEQMSQNASGKPGDANRGESASPTISPSPKKNQSGRVTRSFKGKKEVVIEIAALKGKGYPEMVSAGSTAKTARR
jgi:hypothetical protein